MSLGIQLLLAFALGGGLGALIGWLLGRGGRATATVDSGLTDELKGRTNQLESQLNESRNEVLQTKTALATAQANQASAEKLLAAQKQLHEQNLREAKLAQDKAIAELREAFKALSADALKQTAPEFLRLAEQSFGKFQETAKVNQVAW